MTSDLLLIFSWWLPLFTLGLIFFPLTQQLFPRFHDRGYAFSKIVGIFLLSYLAWLFSSLRILPFSTPGVWTILLILTGLNLVLWKKKKLTVNTTNWRILATEEFFFFVVFTFWALTRGFQPDIEGLEKFMDFGFVNSILRAKWMPPLDMWFAGGSINYYYFGHFYSAVLIKLSNFNPGVAYNLLIATLAALTFNQTFSLTQTLFRSLNYKKIAVFGGFLTALLLTFGGNLQILQHQLASGTLTDYWYPDATRFIIEKFGAADNTIHEFPLYSFVVADLHGHLLNLPTVILLLGLTWSMTTTLFGKNKFPWIKLTFLSLVLAVSIMTNMWDYPIYSLVIGSNFLLFNRKLKTIYYGLFLLILSIIFSLPFHLHFKNIAQGISFVDFHTPLWMLGVLWGEFLFFSLSLIGLIFYQSRFKKAKLPDSDLFVLIIAGVAWLLIVIPEIIYLKDIYINSYQRANTMFKLTYQSFCILSLVSGYTIIRFSSLGKKAIPFFVLTAGILFFVFRYPFSALRSNYGFHNYRGLNGTDYLTKSHADDFKGINWLNQNVVNQPVIVEAVGESYTQFARVSTYTGLPSILGWRVHEWLWRGSFDEPGKRTEEVKEIYEGTDPKKTQELFKKYEVQYLFLGEMERQQYPNLNEEKIAKLGRVVFTSGETKIFQF